MRTLIYITSLLCLLAVIVDHCNAGAEKPNKDDKVIEDYPYLQDVSWRYAFPTEQEGLPPNWNRLPFDSAPKNLMKASAGDCFFALSGGVLYALAAKSPVPPKTSLQDPYGSDWIKITDLGSDALLLTGAEGERDTLFVVTHDNIMQVNLDLSTSTPCGAVSKVEQVFASPALDWQGSPISATASSKSIWVGTDEAGLYMIPRGTKDMKRVFLFGESQNGYDGHVKSLFWNEAWSKLFVGSNIAMFTLTYDTSLKVVKSDHEWTGGNLDTAPVAFAFDKQHDCMWIAERDAAHKLTNDGLLLRYGFHQGAPIGNITSISVSGSQVWIGTNYGLSRLNSIADPSQQEDTPSYTGIGNNPWMFLYFGGLRWLPDNNVIAVVADLSSTPSDSSVMVITSKGLSYIQTKLWTLSEKALALEAAQVRHNRHGLTSSVNLNVFGDVNSYRSSPDDNDGLWTGMHATSECYRFMATRTSDAANACWSAFEGMELLFKVTNAYPTYPARTVCDPSENCGVGDPDWFNSTNPNYPGWRYKGDTSSDEMVGHFLAYPIMHDAAAFMDDADNKQARVSALLDGLLTGIVKNNFHLIDPVTNKPTLWGFWDPVSLNDKKEHYSERGINSLEILSFLIATYSITRNPLYKAAYHDLVTNHGYLRNALNCIIDSPVDDNHSDHELIFNTYLTLFYSHKRLETSTDIVFKREILAMIQPLLSSLRRSWELVKRESMPLWFAIYSGVANQQASPKEINNAMWSMRQTPLDLVNWPYYNQFRWDCPAGPFYVRGSVNDPIMRAIRPMSERAMSHYNNDPFEMNGGGGYTEFEPSVLTEPYWILVGSGVLKYSPPSEL